MGEERQTVRAVERALDVLLCFVGAQGGLGVTQIADRLGLYKSTVHRLLAALEAKGFVRQDEETEKYHLGLRVLELAAAFLATDNLADVAYPEMARLRDEVGETVSLYVRDGTDRVRVQRAEGRHALRRVVALGQRLPLYLGASGKVLLAFCPPEERDRILQKVLPPGFDEAALRAQLEQVRRQGWASSSEEREEGVASVAAPILDRSGYAVAALAISGPAHRFDPETVIQFADKVRAAARTIALQVAPFAGRASSHA